MTIAAVLARKGGEVVTVPIGSRVSDAVSILARHRIGAVPIVDDGGRVAGILSERDVIYCLSTQGTDALALGVDVVMTTPAISVSAEVPVLSALSQMSVKRIRHLPVLEGDDLIGLVSIGDLVAHRIAHIEGEAEAMRAYIQGA